MMERHRSCVSVAQMMQLVLHGRDERTFSDLHR